MNTGDLLKGQVVLITGASKGIGKALSIGLASAGASVSCAARTRELLDLTVDEIHQNGGRALALVADVTKESGVRQMLQRTAKHFGRLNILVLNAGGNLDHDLVEDGDSENWRRTIELNLMRPYYCANAAIPC